MSSLPRSPAYLRGIETFYLCSCLYRFHLSPAYLRGIETLTGEWNSRPDLYVSPAYLRGIETPGVDGVEPLDAAVSSLPKRN